MSMPAMPILRRPLVALGLAGAILAGCAHPEADAALDAQQKLVGMPRHVLLSCAGVPARSVQDGELEFFTYSNSRTSARSTATVGFGGGFGGGPWGYGFGYPLSSTTVDEVACETTVTLRRGQVERIVYGGNGPRGPGRLTQCYRVVENCLAVQPPG